MLRDLQEEIQAAGDPERAKVSAWFFKTGKGEYGEGDIFVGISVPNQRKIALKYKNLSLGDIETLLKSTIHEERLIALFILVSKFTKGNEKEQKEIYDFYLAHAKHVNNWDLVDSSADKIVGEYLLKVGTSTSLSEKNILTKLAASENIWEKRIAIIATYAFIKNGESEWTFKIAEILLKNPSTSSGQMHDLIQKAVGWMLREVGKRVSEKTEEDFLKKHYNTMPRTMLRYAIEKFPEEKRKKYLLDNF